MAFRSNSGYVNAPEYQIAHKLHLLTDKVTGFLHLHENTKTWLRHCISSSMKLTINKRAKYKVYVKYISYI